MRHHILGCIIASLLIGLSGPAGATKVVLLDPGQTLPAGEAMIREAGELRFAVVPESRVLDRGVRTVELKGDEEMYLVKHDGHDIAASGARVIMTGSSFALAAADPAAARVWDASGVCRERIVWIEPRKPGHEPGVDLAATVDPQVKSNIVAAVDQSRYLTIVREISGNLTFWLDGAEQSTNNRYTHTAGSGDDIDIAAAYLEDRLEVAGYPVTRQSFNVSSTTTDNILAIKTGTAYPDEIIVVGAHYDSISESPALRAPGAEDNGSGVAAVLHLAEIFAGYDTERTIHFILFSGEEQGLYGSQHYVSQLGANGWNVVSALTMDMIAAWESNYKVIIEGDYPWASLMTLFEGNVATYALIGSRKDFVSFGSDHVSFQQAGIPAFLAVDWDWESYAHYHRTSDTWRYLDASLGSSIVKAMAATLADLTNPSPTATGAPEVHWRLALRQNSPNPFNPRTVIKFETAVEGPVSLRVFDLAGRSVQTIVEERLPAGRHIAQWNGTDGSGKGVASGVYMLRLESGGRVLTRRMTLLR